MRYSSRFWLYAPLCLFLALAGWVMLHWWAVAGAFDKKLAALKGHEAAPGIVLDWSKVTISGFPFRIDAVFDGFGASGAGAHGPWRWTADKFALHFLTYGRNQDVYEAEARQTLRWTDAAGRVHAIAFLPGALQASSVADGRGLARFDLHIIAGDGDAFTAGDIQLHLRRDPDHKSLDLMASAQAMNAKAGLAPFGKRIDSLQVYAHLTDIAALNPLLAGARSWPEAAKAFEAAGGTLLIDKAGVTSQGLVTEAADPRLGVLFAPLY